MNTEESSEATVEVSCAEARAEFDRLLADPRFHGTERTRSILRYLAERRFEGQDESVKAYTIAFDILGRTSDFDPTIDPIVRIEMSRLRSALSQYYEAFGEETAVAITLPKGNYVAVFTRTSDLLEINDAQEGADTEDRVPHTASQQLVSDKRQIHGPRRDWRAPVLLVAGLSLIAVTFWFAIQPDFAEKPIVAVTMSAADETLEGEAGHTREMLMAALTQFRTLTMTTDSSRNRSLSMSLRPRLTNTYAIDLKYYGGTDDRSIWWQVVNVRTGDLLRSGLERVSTHGKADVTVREELVTMLSRRFATTRGVINAIETHDSADGSLGNSCVLRAEYDLDDGGSDDLAGAEGCLDRTVATEPFNSDANAALSRVIIAMAGGNPSSTDMERSLDLANRAVNLAPLSDRAQIALMMAHFYSGRTESAINAGKKALALNPNNPDVAAKFGMVLFTAGYFDAGVSLAQDAGRAVDSVPRDATLVLALDAFRRKDWSGASLLAEQINCSDIVVRMLRAAALGELGSDQAAKRLADVRSRDPDFERNYPELMAARRFVPALAAAIETGLAKAGANIEVRSIASTF
jgi:tetratricopeptide (TPR) repeat protein